MQGGLDMAKAIISTILRVRPKSWDRVTRLRAELQ